MCCDEVLWHIVPDILQGEDRNLASVLTSFLRNIYTKPNYKTLRTTRVLQCFNNNTCFVCSLISYIYPSRNEELLNALKKKRMTIIGKPISVPDARVQ